MNFQNLKKGDVISNGVVTYILGDFNQNKNLIKRYTLNLQYGSSVPEHYLNGFHFVKNIDFNQISQGKPETLENSLKLTC